MTALPLQDLQVSSFSEFLEEIAEGIERIQSGDFEPVFRKAMVDFEEYHDFWFQEEVAYTGAPWAELSPITIEAKGHGRILYDTGRLMRSLTSDSPDAIREIAGDVYSPSFRFGTFVEYAVYHQVGTDNMPARPIVGITEQGMERLSEDVFDHIVGLFFVGPPDSRN